MDNITFWKANGVEMVTVKESEDLFRTMTKAHWEALEAAKENGTIS